MWDCIVVGGGAAGLSAALVLGRARRRTLVVDAGQQSNRPAHGIGGLLGQDGRPPDGFYAAAREELAAYPAVELRAGEVVDGRRTAEGFELDLADAPAERARCVLLATGMAYGFPDLPGAAERWGGSVFHCPFCHGWEVRDRPLALLGGDAVTAQRAPLLLAWSDDVTLLTDGPPGFEPDVGERLRAAGVRVEERRVVGLRGPGAELEAVELEDGGALACGGLLVPARLRQRSPLAARLGAQAGEPTPTVADPVAVDAGMRTNVPGLLAAGDVTGRMPSVANAVAAGSTAAAMVVHDLML